MDSEKSSKMNSSCTDSVSFPNTMSKSTKPFQMGSKVFKFQPVRSDILLKQLLEDDEDSPKSEKKQKHKTSHITHRELQANKDSSNSDNEDADQDILNQPIIDFESTVNRDLVPGVTWLDTPPNSKPLKIIVRPTLSTPMTNMLIKSSIHSQPSSLKGLRSVSTDRRDEDKLMQTSVKNNNLFKTPICKNSKIIPSSSVAQKRIYSENAIHPTNNRLLSATKRQSETSASKQKLQIQINKNIETPRSSIIQSAINRNFNTPRPTIPCTIKEDKFISSSGKKIDPVLNSDEVKQLMNKQSAIIEIRQPVIKQSNIEQKQLSNNSKLKQLSNELKQTNSNELKQTNSNELKQTNSNELKQANSNELKQTNSNELKQSNSSELKQPLNKQQNTNAEKQLPNKQIQKIVPVKTLQESTFQQLKIRGKEYIVINKIGQGGSGQVYRCLEQETLQDRAIKVVNLNVNPTTLNSYMEEVKMLDDLQGNDRIIRMFDYQQINQNLFVVMEKGDVDFSIFLRNISTESHIQTHVIICYWIEMLKCVREIHKKGIIHSDLKPSNFLIVGGRLKLIDFGIASRISAEVTSIIKNETFGTLNYISPEALCESGDSSTDTTDQKPQFQISYKSDVWSLGCILYQMIYKRTPFQSIRNIAAKFAVIVDRNHKIDYQQIRGVPLYLIDMLKKCLVFDMRSRPSVDELLNMYYDGNYC